MRACLTIIFLLTNLLIYSQPRGFICFEDEPGNFDEEALKKTITGFSSADSVNDYFIQIKKVLNIEAENYVIRGTTINSAWCFGDPIDNNIIITTVINKDYFEKMVTGNEERKAVLIFVIAHELAHCHYNDPVYSAGDTKYANFLKEIRADDKAGYAVAKLCQVGIDFLEKSMVKIFKNLPNSNTHPEACYRTLAMTGGWIQGKTESLKYKAKIVIDKRFFQHSVSEYESYGEVSASGDLHGVRKLVLYSGFYYENKLTRLNMEFSDTKGMDSKSLFFSNYDSTQKATYKSGFFINGNWLKTVDGNCKNIYGEYHFIDSSLYIGELTEYPKWDGRADEVDIDSYNHNVAFEGWGKRRYSSGATYIGEWHNNEKNGIGVLYKNGVVIKDGVWKEDKYIGKN